MFAFQRVQMEDLLLSFQMPKKKKTKQNKTRREKWNGE
jgi:hypothetical protein